MAKKAGSLKVINRVEDKVESLLQKIDQVLEEQEVRIPFSRPLSAMMQAEERGQYFIIDTERTLEGLDVAANIGAVAHGFVTTSSPLEDLWKSQRFLQYLEWQQGTYSVLKVAEENKVEAEHK